MVRICRGDQTAFDALFHRHHALLRTIIARVINNHDDVEDVIQDGFLEVWRQAGNYQRGKGVALAWIVTICRRRAIDHVRRRMAYGRARERFCKEVTRVGDAAFSRADDAVLDHDRAKSVSNLVARLPERQQEAVMLTFYRGMTQRQIAAHTGIPLGTIKTRIELALRKLRRALLISGHELHECLKAA